MANREEGAGAGRAASPTLRRGQYAFSTIYHLVSALNSFVDFFHSGERSAERVFEEVKEQQESGRPIQTEPAGFVAEDPAN